MGCATTTVHKTASALSGLSQSQIEFAIDTQCPLGFNAESGADPASVGIAQWGVAREAKVSWNPNTLGIKAQGAQLLFPSTISCLYWYATLSPEGMMKHQMPKGYTIEWYQPSGSLFKQNKFKSSFWNESYLRTKVEFPKPLPETLIGRWRVRVSNDTQLIDDRYFEIVGAKA